MKTLLSISLLTFLFCACNNGAEKQPEQRSQKEEQGAVTNRIDSASLPADNRMIEADEPAIDEAQTDEPTPEPTAEKPSLQGEMPDTSRKQIMEHGAPDKTRNDSVKAAKTKGKF